MDRHRWLDVATRPRWLIAAAIAAALVIAAGVVLLQSGDDPAPTASDTEPGNATADAGPALLGGRPIDSVGDTYADDDNDGLPNLLENYVYGSDPQDPDTSGSSVPDGWLAEHGYDPTRPGVGQAWAAYPGPGKTPPAHGPDGLSPEHRMTLAETYAWQRPADWNVSEQGPWDNGLDPTTWDQGAGLPFTWLIHHELDPVDPTVGDAVLDPEPDGDGRTVNESYRTATDPRATDTDRDGLDDDTELDDTGTDPARFSTTGRGVADGWAVHHGLDPLDPGMAFRDPDTDGLANREEFNASVELAGLNATLAGEGLDPRDAYSGGTSIPDGWLVEMGLDPLDSDVASTVLQRSTDYGPAQARGVEEVVLTVEDAYSFDRPENWSASVDGPWMGGLSATTNDTDGDGLPDAVELAGWTVNVTVGTGPGRNASDEHVTANPKRPDSDGDGLGDRAEFRGRVLVDADPLTFAPTDPTSRDTDFDGLSDHVEVVEVPRKAREAGVEGDTLAPTVQDTDADGLPDGPEFAYWTDRAARYHAGATIYRFDHRQDDGVAILASMPGARGAGGVATQDTVAAGLEPWGDFDDDELINVLDQDADGDELHDGWEIDPSTYAQSPFASEHERPATDPGNDDTDGDDLPDGWETRYADWDLSRNLWNLDPSTWDTLGDGTPDGQRDLDDDGITWYTFSFTGAGYEREDHTFEATNLVEYEHGSDPNEASTPDNNLLDGWTIFWGQVYPDKDASEVGDVYPGAPGPLVVPPGAPRPTPTEDVDAVTDEATRTRFDTQNDPQSGEVLETVYSGVEDASSGEVKDIYRFRERVQYTFQLEQAHETNPYLRDTDADGAPDAWETAYAAGLPTPDPLTFERDDDSDDDGLTLVEETRARTDPTRADTDRAGVPDGEEANPDAPTDPLDPRDDVRLRDADVDTDGDGIPDIDEVQGWTHPTLGDIRTDPTTPDTDGDALLDGRNIELDPNTPDEQARIEDLREQGIVHVTLDDGTIRFRGEVDWEGDPRALSTPDDEVPDGWRAWWGLSAEGTELDPAPFYTHARPPWWDEATMGPWWWGLAPRFDADVDADDLDDVERVGNDFRLDDTDLDQDGLSDVNGEDPTPAARPQLAPPDGFPNAPGTGSDEARQRATHFGVPVGQRDRAGDRDVDADGVPDAHDRAQANLANLEIHAPTTDGATLQAATPYTATGRVTVDDADGTPHPVPNATVAVHLDAPGHALGYAVTDANGTAEIPFRIQPTHQQTNAPPGNAFRGHTHGPVTWRTNLSSLELGPGPAEDPNQLRVQVYNTSGAARPGDPTHLNVTTELATPDAGTTQARANGIRGTVSDPIAFTFEADSTITIDAPESVTLDTPLDLSLTLADGTGDPVPHAPIQLTTGPVHHNLTTDADGHAHVQIPGVTDRPGPLAVNATYAGAEHRLPVTNATTVQVRHATDLAITQATPLPAAAGDPVTVTGHLDAPANATDRVLRVEVPGANTSTTTDADGGFQATLDLPADLPPGETTLGVRFPGTDLLAPASAETQLPVRALPEIGIAVPGGDQILRPNDETHLVVSVTAGNATPLPGQVTVQGLPGEPGPRNVTVGAEGTSTLPWTTSQQLGAHRVLVTRPADDEHQAARNQTWLTIQAPTRITVDEKDLLRGHPVTLTGTLEDAFATPVAGGRVTVTLDGEPIAHARADATGTFEARWTVDRDRPLGPTPVMIAYEPGEGDPWDPTARSLTLPVKSSVHATLQQDHVLRTDPIATLQLATDTGDPVRTGTAHWTIPPLDLAHAAQIDGGHATFNLGIDQTTPPGTYASTLDVRGVPDLETPDIALDVTVATPVEIHAQHPDSAGRGQTLPLDVHLTGDAGRPVTGGTLTAHLADGPQVNATATPNGTHLEVPVPDQTPTGLAELTIAWTGPPGYLDARHEEKIEILRGSQVTLTLPDSAEPGARVEGTLHLTASDGTPLPDRRVVLQDPATGQTTLVTTDDDGRAPVLLQTRSLEPTRLTVRYPGDDAHAASVTTHAVHPATPTPQRGPGAGLVAAGVLALIALAAASVWAYRRRRLQAEVAETLDEGASRVLVDNEHHAVVLMTYDKLVRILSDHDVVPQDTDTLREYQHEIQHRLGVRTDALEALFDVFDEALYAAGPTGAGQARRAHRAFSRVADELRERLGEPADPAEGPDEEVSQVA